MRWKLDGLPGSLLACLVLFTTSSCAAKINSKDALKLDFANENATSTFFNGQEVPPIVDLNGTTFNDDISKGYWLVDSFSPYCHHCQSLAPKWQTLYEFYYTSDPLPASTEPVDAQVSLNSFSRYYDLKWGKLDCIAFGTACSEIHIESFPTIILFKDGKEFKRQAGDHGMKDLSEFIEESLETIRPGSRPQGGVNLPKVGAKQAPKQRSPSTLQNSPDMRNIRPAAGTSSGRKSSKAPKPPNPDGVSIEFSAESFQKRVTRTLNPWFVKFYVPWCPHCQRMKPTWDSMAREMQGRLNVGEVNCDTYKRLCRDVHVNGYPTMVFFKGPEHIEYEGLRGLGDLIDYTNKAVDAISGVPEVSLNEFEELEEKEEVIFVYFYDHATTSEDFMALDRLPLPLIGRAKIVKTKDLDLAKRFSITTWPRLLVSRDGKSSEYEMLSPEDMRNVNKISGWMSTVWLPLVPELTAANARDIMDGKFVVLAILNRERKDEFATAKREIKNAASEWIERQRHAFDLERQELRDAKQLRIEEAEDRNDQRALRNAKLIRINMDEIERKEVAFAWVDGLFWDRWIRSTFGISVKDGEKVIINDEDNRRYWDNTITGNPIVPSRTSILETLNKVVTSPPKLAAKPSGSKILYNLFRFRSSIMRHPILAAISSLVLLVVGLVGWRKVRRRSRSFGSNTGGFFQLGEREKQLTNGAQANGKVD